MISLHLQNAAAKALVELIDEHAPRPLSAELESIRTRVAVEIEFADNRKFKPLEKGGLTEQVEGEYPRALSACISNRGTTKED